MRRLALTAVLIVMCIPKGRAAELVPLGFLYPNEPGRFSLAAGLSADGLVAVGVSDSSLSSGQAFRWTQQTGMIGLGFLSPTDAGSIATGVSCDGSVVVGYSFSPLGENRAFRWTQQTGMQPLGFLSPETPESWATAVSCDGSVVVGVSDTPIGAEAFRWTNATGMVGIGELPGGDYLSRATGVSYDGNVIVGFSSSGPQGGVYEAFLWTAATAMIPLGDVPGIPIGSYVSQATGISGNSTDAASAVVTGRASGPEAFGWTLQSGMFGLGVDVPGPYPTGAHSWGGAISADGHAIVGYWQYPSQPFLETRAMLWDQLVGMVDLKTTMDPAQTPSLTGWTLIHADGISADGSVITGWGKNPMDEEEAFIAREVVASKPIDFEKTQSHIICCWQPPGPDPWMRVFDGSASGTTPACAPIVSYEWDFGDGEKGAGEIGRHRFTRPGIYRVQLTVRDACRGVATDVVEVPIGQR